MPSSKINQTLRPLEIITPLEENVLGLRSIQVSEQLSGGFVIEADLSSEDPDIKFDAIVGHPVAIRLDLPGQKVRYWHAQVSRFMMVGESAGYFHYHAVLVPWSWGLTRSADCRMFQKLSISEIVQQVFRDRGAKDFEVRLSGTYSKWEYCVQYRESDYKFVSRLLEQEGIAYYFKHDKDKGQLVLADEKASYDPVQGYGELYYRPIADGNGAEDAIQSWIIEHEVQPTQYALTDYDPLKPKESLLRTAKADRGYGMNDRQVFDYPGQYSTPAEAERLTRVRLDELQCAAEIMRAQTTCLGLGTGCLFTLKDHPRSEQNREYLVTSLNLKVDAGEFGSDTYHSPHATCAFTAIPSSQTFRPARTTPRPVVYGPQSAVVVGPAGEEIYTDEYGRVKVSFYWDRESKADDKSSCWLRVAQSWAGKKWGAFYLPRIGQEVLVEFLEGNPDDPIVTGCVYNAENKPPYDLPAEKTKSTVKSYSSKGGGGFNEIRCEDKKGEEQIYIHGEKNLDIRIKSNCYETIGYDRHLIVAHNQVEHIKYNRDETVDADHKEWIGKDRHLKVAGKEAKEVVKSLSLTVKGDVIEVFKQNHSEQTANDYYLKADNIVIEALTNLTLKVGNSYIAIEAGGIKISTTGTVEVESGATLALKAEAGLTLESAATAEMSSPATTVKADGALTLSGGVVMIN
ncbi:MAG: type VI secretion system tip protein TssI/VgrG [Opitutus sp.]